MDDPFDFEDFDFDTASESSGPSPGPTLTLEEEKPRSTSGGGSNTRLYGLISVVFLVLTVIVLVLAVAIGLNPNAAFNPLPPGEGGGSVGELPTAFVIPTQPPTDTAQPGSGFPTAEVSTALPSLPTPDSEGTATPEPGEIPGEGTPTVDVLGTVTAQPSVTATTQGGELTSTVEAPVPVSYPFELQAGSPVFNQNPDSNGGCDFAGVAGLTFNLNGDPLTTIAVRVVGENFDSLVYTGTSVQYGESGYEILLNTAPLEAEFEIQLFTPSGQPLTEKIVFRTRDTCAENVILLSFNQISDY